MTPQEFAKYRRRDGDRCMHCGTTEGLVPNHRRNRGMGGGKSRHKPSNVVVLCSAYNFLIEADPISRREAINYGWKLTAYYHNPETIPVYDKMAGKWYLLDNEYGRAEAK